MLAVIQKNIAGAFSSRDPFRLQPNTSVTVDWLPPDRGRPVMAFHLHGVAPGVCPGPIQDMRADVEGSVVLDISRGPPDPVPYRGSPPRHAAHIRPGSFGPPASVRPVRPGMLYAGIWLDWHPAAEDIVGCLGPWDWLLLVIGGTLTAATGGAGFLVAAAAGVLLLDVGGPALAVHPHIDPVVHPDVHRIDDHNYFEEIAVTVPGFAPATSVLGTTDGLLLFSPEVAPLGPGFGGDLWIDPGTVVEDVPATPRQFEWRTNTDCSIVYLELRIRLQNIGDKRLALCAPVIDAAGYERYFANTDDLHSTVFYSNTVQAPAPTLTGSAPAAGTVLAPLAVTNLVLQIVVSPPFYPDDPGARRNIPFAVEIANCVDIQGRPCPRAPPYVDVLVQSTGGTYRLHLTDCFRWVNTAGYNAARTRLCGSGASNVPGEQQPQPPGGWDPRIRVATTDAA